MIDEILIGYFGIGLVLMIVNLSYALVSSKRSREAVLDNKFYVVKTLVIIWVTWLPFLLDWIISKMMEE